MLNISDITVEFRVVAMLVIIYIQAVLHACKHASDLPANNIFLLVSFR
jgi:hypothetical protein